jgi:MFS family permease
MIVTMFPEPREQAKALGVYGFVASAGGSIGLLAGGVLTDAISWHWIFFINIPIGVLTGVLALRLVEARPGLGIGAGTDILGAVLLTGGTMLGVYAILEKSFVLGAIAVALVAAFVLRQSRVAHPLMPLRLFRSKDVTGSNAIMALLVVGMFGSFFMGALYLQRVLGYTPLQVGLAFLPGTLVMAFCSLRLSHRFAPRTIFAPALLTAAAGLALFVRMPVDGTYVVDVLPSQILIGLGMGLGMPAMMSLAMSGVEPQDAGLASGLINTTVQVGGAIGLAVLATIASQTTGASEALPDLLDGYHAAFAAAAAAMGLATVLAFALTSSAVVLRVRDVLQPSRV